MFRQKLKGGALYIALIICIVTGIILSTFILIAYFNQKKVISQMSADQLLFHLKSGKELAQSYYFDESQNSKWQQIAGSEDSLRIKKLQWGAYELISVEAKNRHFLFKESGLYGDYVFRDTALLTIEKSRPIGLAGKIKLNGNCYLPKAGVKPAYIEGQGYQVEGSLQAFIKESPSTLPELNPLLVKELKKNTNNFNSNTDSLCSELIPILTHPFSTKTLVFESGRLNLSNYQLSGNIKLIGSVITVENSSKTDNILIIADKVVIKKGFKGSLHIIARDSILLENDCTLDYPTSLTVLTQQKTDNNLRGVFLGENCIVNGAILAIKDESAKEQKMFVRLNKDCEIFGIVYSQGYCHVQGKIYGSIFCETLLVKTLSAVYENHILDAELDSRKFAGSLVIPSIFKNNKNRQCCKYL